MYDNSWCVDVDNYDTEKDGHEKWSVFFNCVDKKELHKRLRFDGEKSDYEYILRIWQNTNYWWTGRYVFLTVQMLMGVTTTCDSTPPHTQTHFNLTPQ